MSVAVAERFVDVVLRDGPLANPVGLLAALRKPAGRKPAQSSLAIADALSSIDDAKALTIIAATLDSAYFSVLNLLDANLKNSGIRVTIEADGHCWASNDHDADLHIAYRDRVEPNGSVRNPS